MYDNWNAPGEPKKHTKLRPDITRFAFFLFLVIIHSHVLLCVSPQNQRKRSHALRNQFSDDFMEAASVNVVNWAEPFLR